MAKSLASLRTTRTTNPPVIVLYGVHGSGKTTLAAEFPGAAYLFTSGERPPSDVDLPGAEVESFQDVLDFFESLLTTEHDFKTVIVDSLDGLEPLVWADTCQKNGWANIEDAGYGKGYIATDANWRDYLGGVQELSRNGIAVVQIAHTDIARFDSPTTDPYSRYGIKLHKRASGLVQEAADIVGFINYRVTLKEKDVGFNKKVGHAEGGGDRQIHLEERPGFLAKNRYSMPSSLPLKKGAGYDALAKFFPAPVGVKAAT
jgi:hypothetical protein